MSTRQNKSILLLVMVSVMCLALPKAGATVVFDDGQSHYIDYPISDFVWVKGTRTTVYRLEGATAIGLEVYDYSYITVIGGSTGYDLEAYGHGQITMTGGQIGDGLGAYEQGQIVVSGGSISGDLIAGDYGILTIQGTDFAVDGNPFGYGELTSILGGYWGDEPSRLLTGTLANGDSLYNPFYIGSEAKIILVPEPIMLLLLGLGGLMVRRKRVRGSFGQGLWAWAPTALSS